MLLLHLCLISTASAFCCLLGFQRVEDFTAKAYLLALRGVALIFAMGAVLAPAQSGVVWAVVITLFFAQRALTRSDIWRAKFLLSLASATGLTLGTLGAIKTVGLPAGCPPNLATWFVIFAYAGGISVAASLLVLWSAWRAPMGKHQVLVYQLAGAALGLRLLLVVATLRYFPFLSPDWGNAFTQRLFPIDQVGTWFSYRVLVGFFLAGAFWLLSFSAWKAKRGDTQRLMSGLLAGSVISAELVALWLRL
jgi:hypothetical protein